MALACSFCVCLPAVAESLDIAERVTAAAFLQRTGCRGKPDNPLPDGSGVRMQFIPKNLGLQRAFSLPGAAANKITHTYLYVDNVGYDPETKSLGIVLVVFREDVGDSALVLGFTVYLQAGAEVASDVARALEDTSLVVELDGTLASGQCRREVETGGGTKCYPAWQSAEVKFKSMNTAIISGRATLRDALSLESNCLPVKKMKKLVTATVLAIEAEEMSSLIWFSDFERDATGWYALELYTSASADHVAVVHGKNMGAVATHTFAKPLPPGTYRVHLDPHKGSSRWDDNILEVTLGDASGRVTWMYSTRGDDLFTCHPLVTKVPAGKLEIKAVKCGGGGVNTVPEMPEPTIMLDTIRIDRIEWQDPGVEFPQ